VQDQEDHRDDYENVNEASSNMEGEKGNEPDDQEKKKQSKKAKIPHRCTPPFRDCGRTINVSI